MCLSVPAKVISVSGDNAIVSVSGTEYNASIQLVDDVKPGDYILLHTGFALQKLSEEEALETLKIFEEYEEFNKKLDNEELETGERIV
jgi:hydrogenase expression/formation protein HypC